MDTLEVSANHAFLVILAIEVDEHEEEYHKDNDADARDDGRDHGGGLNRARRGEIDQVRGSVLGVSCVTCGCVGQMTLSCVPGLS